MTFALFLALSLASSLPTVSIPSGANDAATLQAAIDACPTTGCRIELPSAKYQLVNQIWILDKENIEIVGTNAAARTVVTWSQTKLVKVANPLARANLPALVPAIFTLRPPAGGGRPDTLPAGWLMWPYIGSTQTRSAIGPVGSAVDYSNPYSTNGYQHNGMFLVKNSRYVHFRHLKLDGGQPFHFLNTGIWGLQYAVLAGSVGVNFYQSLHGTVADCELVRFWTAVYLNDRNPAALMRENPNDIVLGPSKYLQACGRMGGHLVEQNEIHHCWWAANSESAWDLGSVFRENLAWELKNTLYQYSDSLAPTLDEEMKNNLGGFLMERDVVYPAHVVSNNSMREVLAPYAWTGYRTSAHALFSQNAIGPIPRDYGPFQPLNAHQQQLGRTGLHLRSNTVALDPRLATAAKLGQTNFVDANFPVYPLRLDTNKLTGQVDTIWETAAKGWFATPLPPVDSVYSNIQGAVSLHMNAPYRGDSVHFTATDGRGVAHALTGWKNDAYDTVGWLKPAIYYTPLPQGLDSSLLKNQYVLVSKFRTDSDANRASYFLPDATPEILRRAYSPNGEFRGAFGPDGRIGSQYPGRARVAGAPRFDAVARKLHLPIRLGPHGVPDGSVTKFVVLTGSMTAFQINESSGDGHVVRETMSAFPTPDPIGPDATEIVIPFAGTDTLLQFDLTLGLVDGDRTYPTTPIAWIWAKGMKPDTTVRPPTSGFAFPCTNRILRTGTDAKGWYVDLQSPSKDASLMSLDGRMEVLVADPSQGGSRLRPARKLDGIWLLCGSGIQTRTLFLR